MTPAEVTVAVSSCARTGSSGAVFDAIRTLDPLLYISAGDLHYGDPARDDVRVFGDLYRRTLTAPAVTDSGTSSIVVELAGRRWDGTVLVTYRVALPAPAADGSGRHGL